MHQLQHRSPAWFLAFLKPLSWLKALYMLYLCMKKVGNGCAPMLELRALCKVKLRNRVTKVSLGTLGRANKLLDDLSACISAQRTQQPRRSHTAGTWTAHHKIYRPNQFSTP